MCYWPSVARSCSRNASHAGEKILRLFHATTEPVVRAGFTLDDIAGLAEGARIAEPFTVTFPSDGGSRMVTDPRKVLDWARRVAALA